jgi:Regulator of chromosome condensation (RCC1) repeat.
MNMTLLFLETGEIFSWGVGEHGALGNGTTVDIWQPERIYLDAKIQVKARKASAGARHSAFISGDFFPQQNVKA